MHHLGKCSYLLCCPASSGVQSQGFVLIPTHIWACTHIQACSVYSAVQTISTWHGISFYRPLVHLETDILLGSSQGHRVMCTCVFRECGMLQWSRSSLCGWGKEAVAVLVWLMGQHQRLRGREAQRVDLINNRTYP